MEQFISGFSFREFSPRSNGTIILSPKWDWIWDQYSQNNIAVETYDWGVCSLHGGWQIRKREMEEELRDKIHPLKSWPSDLFAPTKPYFLIAHSAMSISADEIPTSHTPHATPLHPSFWAEPVLSFCPLILLKRKHNR
jgi:hypothetical protein